jgi:hypothetical protein
MLRTEQNDLKASHHIRRSCNLDLILLYSFQPFIRKDPHCDLHITKIVCIFVFNKAIFFSEFDSIAVGSLSESFSESGHIDRFKKIRLSLRVFTDQNVGALAKINACRFYIFEIFNANISAKHCFSFLCFRAPFLISRSYGKKHKQLAAAFIVAGLDIDSHQGRGHGELNRFTSTSSDTVDQESVIESNRNIVSGMLDIKFILNTARR